jgi:hypothetical protein
MIRVDAGLILEVALTVFAWREADPLVDNKAKKNKHNMHKTYNNTLELLITSTAVVLHAVPSKVLFYLLTVLSRAGANHITKSKLSNT